MGKRALLGLGLGAGIALLGATAQADPFRYPTDDTYITTYPGDNINLPVGPRVTVRDAVNAARGLQVARTAMDEFGRRGYVAHPEADSAVFRYDVGATIVLLAYSKPGFAPGPNSVGGPMIVVATTVDPTSGLPSTTCTAGVMIVDKIAQRVFTADSLAEYRESDASFDVTPGTGEIQYPGDPNPVDPSDPKLKRAGATPAYASGGTSRFSKLADCIAYVSAGCLGLMFGLSWAPPAAGIAFFLCMMVGVIACVNRVLAGQI
jgi:hypothetical protein